MKDNVFYLVLVFLAYFLVTNILKRFGLITDPEELKAYNQFMQGANSDFKPFKIIFTPSNYASTINELSSEKKAAFVEKMTIENVTAPDGKFEVMYKQILGAKRFVNDDEQQLFSALAKIGSLQELHFFVFCYQRWCEENAGYILIQYLEDVDNVKVLGEYLANDFLSKGDILKLKKQFSKLKNFNP